MSTHPLPDTNTRLRGFTLWELMVVVSLVIFLFAAAVESLLPLRGDAERAAVFATVGSLRNAVGMESVQRVISDDGPDLANMHGANPMHWLAIRPGSYAGEIGADYQALAPGQWGFDPGTGVLFYRVRYPEYFDGSFMTPPGMRFRVTALRGDDGGLDQIILEQLDAGGWTTDGSQLGRWLGERR